MLMEFEPPWDNLEAQGQSMNPTSKRFHVAIESHRSKPFCFAARVVSRDVSWRGWSFMARLFSRDVTLQRCLLRPQRVGCSQSCSDSSTRAHKPEKLRGEAFGVARKERALADILSAHEQHHQALKPQACAPMRRRAIPERVAVCLWHVRGRRWRGARCVWGVRR